jgi:hypothetical protein
VAQVHGNPVREAHLAGAVGRRCSATSGTEQTDGEGRDDSGSARLRPRGLIDAFRLPRIHALLRAP